MKTERHIMALLKFLKMFTVFLVRLGLCSSTCFISSLLILTAVIGITCFIITLFFSCYYRYYTKHCTSQRNQASALCACRAGPAAQQTQCLFLGLLLGFGARSAEPRIGFCTSEMHIYRLYSSRLVRSCYFF